MSDIFSYLAGAGDCWANNGNFSSTSQTLFLAKHGSLGTTNLRTWIPFVVTLPREVVIASAVIRWYANNTQSTNVGVIMRCEAADNPSSPVDDVDVQGRAVTAASASYNLEAYTIGNQYSYDITAAVQEVLNRAGWVSSNTLAVVIDNAGTTSNNRREIASYDNITYPQATLEITVPTFIPRNIGVI